ncbi:MAG TPA: hypothetical protein VN495_02655 [Candidatus Paceibacterota bacterium]|nr:hypothetical protein [Candidatus Paceibacterota bacterium]
MAGNGKSKPIGKVAGKFFEDYLFFKFNPFDLTDFLKWAGGWGISRGLVLWIFFIGLMSVLSLQIPNLPLFALAWLIGTAPVWLPIGSYYVAVNTWIWYVQSNYLSNREGVLLEVKMPRDVTKSPRAMELAYIPFNLSSGETTVINRAWQGGVRPFWSFEIASFGGDVHFYIWTWKSFRDLVESSIYAYYPEVELVEAEDYATKFRFDPAKHDCYCTEWPRETFRATGPRSWEFGLNAFPILTYIDFELNKDPKEEFKIDPLAEPIEFMSSLRPEDQMWVQIVIREAGIPSTHVFGKPKDNDNKKWVKAIEEGVHQVRIDSLIRLTPEQAEEFGRGPRAASTWVHQELIQSMERQMLKYPFEVGIRGWIVSTKEVTSHYYNGMRWMWRPMGNPYYSSWLRPRRWHPPFDYPWQDYRNLRWNTAARRFIDAYRRRLFFHSPWKLPTNIMSNEELATMWHPLSRAVASPGVERIPAKKAEPPGNLPM